MKSAGRDRERHTNSRFRFRSRRCGREEEDAPDFCARIPRSSREPRERAPHPHKQGLGTLKQFYTSTFWSVFPFANGHTREEEWNSSCIFFLTFNAKHLIKGTQPRSRKSGANFDVKGESIDEERNEEESACEEEGC